MLLRPVIVHFAVVAALLPVAAVCAVLDRADSARERLERTRRMRVGPCF